MLGILSISGVILHAENFLICIFHNLVDSFFVFTPVEASLEPFFVHKADYVDIFLAERQIFRAFGFCIGISARVIV